MHRSCQICLLVGTPILLLKLATKVRSGYYYWKVLELFTVCALHVQYMLDKLTFSGTWGCKITFSNGNIQIKLWMNKMGWFSWSFEYVTMCAAHTFFFSFKCSIISYLFYCFCFWVALTELTSWLSWSHRRKPYIGNKCWNRSWQPFSGYLLLRKRLQILVGRYQKASFPFVGWKNSKV